MRREAFPKVSQGSRFLLRSDNMDTPSPDLLRAMEGRFKKQTYVIAIAFMALVACLSAFGARWSYLSNQRLAAASAPTQHIPIISDVRRLLFGAQANGVAPALPSEKGRLNVLILGIGGAGHEGSNLTDSILVASVDLENKRVGLVSIPRDLAYPLGSGRFEKINAVHAYAEQEAPGEGAVRTAQAFSQLLEIPIDHVVRIDFQGFTKFIDAIGGVTVNVETAFTDPTYPVGESGGVKTVSFKKGPQAMTGEQALTFARSRHGNNGEGSDFARSRRQQLVMLAVREKLLSLGTLADPGKLADMYRVVSEHIQTDLSVWDLLKFAPLANEFSPDRVTMTTLTDAPDGVLASANVGGAYMLFPKQPDWSEIRAIVRNPFETTTARKQQERPKETVRLEVKNGTFRTNFAAQAAAKLERNGYEIGALGNAARRGFERSAIYDLTGGKKPAELARLQRLLGADVVSVSPDQLVTTNGGSYRTFPLDTDTLERVYSQTTDFLLILGDASFAFVEAK